MKRWRYNVRRPIAEWSGNADGKRRVEATIASRVRRMREDFSGMVRAFTERADTVLDDVC